MVSGVIVYRKSRKLESIVRSLIRKLGSKYRVGTYAILALHGLLKLGFSWEHIVLLDAIVDDKKVLSMHKEAVMEYLQGLKNFLDDILDDLLQNGYEEELQSLFTPKELEELQNSKE